jgi:hypothetical protein
MPAQGGAEAALGTDEEGHQLRDGRRLHYEEGHQLREGRRLHW